MLSYQNNGRNFSAIVSDKGLSKEIKVKLFENNSSTENDEADIVLSQRDDFNDDIANQSNFVRESKVRQNPKNCSDIT